MSSWTAYPEEEGTMTIQTVSNNRKHIATIQNTKTKFWTHYNIISLTFWKLLCEM
jgi:hypothetical protein